MAFIFREQERGWGGEISILREAIAEAISAFKEDNVQCGADICFSIILAVKCFRGYE